MMSDADGDNAPTGSYDGDGDAQHYLIPCSSSKYSKL